MMIYFFNICIDAECYELYSKFYPPSHHLCWIIRHFFNIHMYLLTFSSPEQQTTIQPMIAMLMFT